MEDGRLPNIVHFSQPYRGKRKAGRPRMGGKRSAKGLKENTIFLRGRKEGSFEYLGMKENRARLCCLRGLGAAARCQ